MTSFLIAYATFSGNTEEVACFLEDELNKNGDIVHMHRIGVDSFPDVRDYDVLIIGTYTWDKGSTPDETKDFIADVGYKPETVYVFGTGDTQFGGDDLFCRAADKVARFYESNFPVLKIEQSPRGVQEKEVIDWVKGVIRHEAIRTSQSVGAG